MCILEGKNILITGGTGSLGTTLLAYLTQSAHPPKKISILSRDEYKQRKLKIQYPNEGFTHIQFSLGDVRDHHRLLQVCAGVDIVIHAAALKQNDISDQYPDEFFKTNVEGTRNIISACQASGVEKLLFISTDKAAYPTSTYGASKLCAEKLVSVANGSTSGTQCSSIRLGNLLGSRASIVHHIQNNLQNSLPIVLTDPNMTRFSMTMPEGTEAIVKALEAMQGGEIFVPNMQAYQLHDLVQVIATDAKFVYSGPRGSEKLHEVLIVPEENRFTYKAEGMYVICTSGTPTSNYWSDRGQPLPKDYIYTSDQPGRRLSIVAIEAMLANLNQ